MPSPRYRRLPEERKAALLAIARRHLARDGLAGASYNQLIAEAGISKTSAYLYFDGREDLVAEVYRDLGRRLADVIGRWACAPDQSSFWEQFDDTSRRLRAHLVRTPDDLALLLERGPAEPLAGTDRWLRAVLDDARRLRLVRPGFDPELLFAVTRALLEAMDGWALERLRRGARVDVSRLRPILLGAWRAEAS